MSLFYPSTHPTYRRRRRVPWAIVFAIGAALLSSLMIVRLARERARQEEVQLSSLVTGAKDTSGQSLPKNAASPAVMNPSAIAAEPGKREMSIPPAARRDSESANELLRK
jgi:hypothetical protein